jgi:hypothetical protein
VSLAAAAVQTTIAELGTMHGHFHKARMIA